MYGEGPLIHCREKYREFLKDDLAKKQEEGAMWADAVGSVCRPVQGYETGAGLQRGCLTHTWPCEVTSALLPLPRDTGLRTAGGKSM